MYWPRAAQRVAGVWAPSLPSALNGLPKSRRLRMAAEFATTLKSRWRGRDETFSVYAVSNPYPYGRLGIVVSRKVSARAVVRNRIKRQIRETFRQSQEKLAGLDVVVVASPKAGMAPAASQRASLQTLWEKVEKQCRKS